MTLDVWVCSASTVMTANGSGRRKTSRLDRPSAATTMKEDMRNIVSKAKVGDWSSPVILSGFLGKAEAG
jgi:hypothetical protein